MFNAIRPLGTPSGWPLETSIPHARLFEKYHNLELVFDKSDPIIDEAEFEKKDWTSSEFAHCAGDEILPANMPKARGFYFLVSARVNADHAGNTTTRSSRKGYISYVNSAPVYWISTKKNMWRQALSGVNSVQ